MASVASVSKKPGRWPTELGGRVVVKAQIHAGGRGKGGGVKVAEDADEAAEVAAKILGMTLVTHQTGPEGRLVQRLLIEETLPIDRELYLGIVLDRGRASRCSWPRPPAAWTSKRWRPRRPELILKETIDPGFGLPPSRRASSPSASASPPPASTPPPRP